MANPYTIVVGGIGGNRLNTAPSAFSQQGSEVWLNPVVLSLFPFARLKLDRDGVSPDRTYGSRLQGDGLLDSYYGTLTTYLAARKRIPQPFVQDWRTPLATVLDSLNALALRYEEFGPLDVVCHSNGGLVVREWLNRIGASGRSRLVRRVIGMGVPHYGSWVAVQLAAGLEPTQGLLSLAVLRNPFDPVNAADPASVTQTSESWPAVYEMFPSPTAPGINPDDVLTIYDNATWKFTRPGVPLNWLAAARTRWASAAPVPTDVKWLDVISSQQRTATGLILSRSPVLLENYDYTNEGGDGTIPTDWQKSGSPDVADIGVAHGAMPYDERVLDAMWGYLSA